MSTIDIQDLRSTIIPRSDQLNSEQLLGGPMILTVSDVRAGGGEDQPVSVYYEADPGRPFKPCKTMRKVLILAWGPDGRQWIGKSMELYCEPSVKFGGEVVGGIRISRLSDIPREIKVSLTATKGRKAMHEIGLLQLSDAVTKVLAAISAASNNETMKKARAMAESLTSESDIGIARAAYAKRVAELKAKAAAPKVEPAEGPSAGADPDLPFLTFEDVRDYLNAAKNAVEYDAACALIPRVEDAAEQAQLNALASKRYAAISKGE